MDVRKRSGQEQSSSKRVRSTGKHWVWSGDGVWSRVFLVEQE